MKKPLRTSWPARSAIVAALGILVAPVLAGDPDWVTFEDQSSSRVSADANLVLNDTEEKDYAWDDFDMDGDTDLIVVRKQPFTTPGRKRNVLLMNEDVRDGQSLNGVLVDRTAEFMSAADDGGQGGLDETNDRDVTVADVDQDGWPDIITSTAYGQGLAKSISHSRIYMNLGEDGGVWQGFRYEEARIPQLVEAPNTCGVAAGDVTGDGYPDLFYVTYNSSNLEDHLLINDGNGFFTNETFPRLQSSWVESSFGTATIIADMNGDGWNDIVKSENGPVDIIYNGGSGFFDDFENASSGAHYHVSLGDINGDGVMDLIVSDDGSDRYRINQGPGGDGRADFDSNTYSFVGGGGDDGFGSNSITVDLDNDGWNDVLIADVDVDIGGCGRRTHIYRNLGNLPVPTMVEIQSGGAVAGIPTSMLSGTHDIAALDINRDGFLDLVIGRCSGTQIWINTPPFGLGFSYPDGLPEYVDPGQDTEILVDLTVVGGAVIDSGTETVHVSTDGGPFQELPMEDLGSGQYRATLPAAECGSSLAYYFTADASNVAFSDPPDAPGASYTAIATLGAVLLVLDEIEGDVGGWLVENDPSLTAGAWEQADPNATLFGADLASPEDDATPGDGNVQAFVTMNGLPGGAATASDIDGGPTMLSTPAFAIDSPDALVSYARWMFSSGTDQMSVEISNDDGASWTAVPSQSTAGTGGFWETTSFFVGDFITPSLQMRVRFVVADNPNDSITEAGVDDFRVDVLGCGGSCPADLDGDGAIAVGDLLIVLGNWGSDADGADLAEPFDLVDVADILIVLGQWGACP